MTEPTPFCLIKRSAKRYEDVLSTIYNILLGIIEFLNPRICNPSSFCALTYIGSFFGTLLMLCVLYGHVQVSYEFGYAVIIGSSIFPALLFPFYAAFYDCYMNKPKEIPS